MVIKSGDNIFILVNLNGFNARKSNITLFQFLSDKILPQKNTFPSASIIVGGDFNEAPYVYIDRYPAEGNPDNINTCYKRFLL